MGRRLRRQNDPEGGSRIISFDSQIRTLNRILSRAGVIAAVILVLLYLSTCIGQVRVQETGVLLRFGRVVRSHVDSGICVKFPWPVDRLVTVKTRSVETVQGGFGADPEQLDEFEKSYGPIDQLSQGTLAVPYIITGDKNILHMKVLINYRVSNPSVYLFGVSDPGSLLGMLIQNVILNCVSKTEVDQLLTSGKIELRDVLNRELSIYLKEIDLGVEILSSEIRNVRPPRTTTQAFKDVINAQEESRESIHQAESYAKRMIPEANAEAIQILSEAEAYRNRTVEAATGEARRFSLIAEEYSNYPALTRERLRQETVEQVFSKASKHILGPSKSGDLPARVRFLMDSAGPQSPEQTGSPEKPATPEKSGIAERTDPLELP